MSAVGDTLRALASTLDARRIRWFVFGAQAVAIRGAPRATQDIDITVQLDRAQLAEWTRALAEHGLSHRYPDIADELLDTGAVIPLVHTSGMEVDVVIAGSGLEAIALDRASRVAIDGVLVPVAHATDLVVMKVLAGRGKDLDDVRSILAGDEVDIAVARDLLRQLEEALGQSDLVPRLDAALAAERRR
jgi:predicted nucleotidyltransferase